MKALDAITDKLFTLISHDLRVPMGEVLGSLDLLSPYSRELSPEDKELLLGEMKSSTRHSLALIENLTAWSRYEVTGLEIQKIPLVVQDVVISAVSKLTYLWKPKEQLVDIQISDCLVLPMEPMLIATVLRNILSNAMKYSPRKGLITIRADWSDDSRWILIEDHGLGMPPGDVTDLVKLRVCPPRPGTEGEQGSGFGLWLCDELMKKLGGKLEITSIPGQGTAVLLRFPEEDVEDL